MAGPTPVSALIHAATMVAAGVYLVGRLFSVFAQRCPGALTVRGGHRLDHDAPGGHLALVQDDIKRVLAYSTVSQLAYMMAALGLGRDGFTRASSISTHTVSSRRCCSSGAGSVIHAVHTNNMSEMGGLAEVPCRSRSRTFLIGTVRAVRRAARSPGSSRRTRSWRSRFHEHNYAVLRGHARHGDPHRFYMARAVTLTFLGSYRGHAHPHESPPVMTAPLVVLASLSLVTGLLNAPQFAGGWWRSGCSSRRSNGSRSTTAARVISVSVALAGLVVGYSCIEPGASATRSWRWARVHAVGAQVLHRRPVHERASSVRSAARLARGGLLDEPAHPRTARCERAAGWAGQEGGASASERSTRT
jgi:NADH-quinone oxidoreductase subunit L